MSWWNCQCFVSELVIVHATDMPFEFHPESLKRSAVTLSIKSSLLRCANDYENILNQLPRTSRRLEIQNSLPMIDFAEPEFFPRQSPPRSQPPVLEGTSR
jgi:hypothetical protein